MLLWLTTPRLAFSFKLLPMDEQRLAAMAFLQHHRARESDFELDGRSIPVLVRDWRAHPVSDFLLALTDNDLSTGPPAPPTTEPFVVLSKDELEHAVKEALRVYTRPSELEKSPLLHCRCVRAAAGDTVPTAQTLRDLLREAMDELSDNPRDAKLLRALEVTYVRPAPAQVFAAERLGVPFSTFRRHLTKGVQRIVSWVAERDVSAR
jgi:DNA-directed RNA polymerase specialized sigma24 family protein